MSSNHPQFESDQRLLLHFIPPLFPLLCPLLKVKQIAPKETDIFIINSVQCFYLDNLSNIQTSFSASYSFCSSVISSMGFGIGSSTWPVMGLMLETRKNYINSCKIILNYIINIYTYAKYVKRVNIQLLELTTVWQICTPLCLSLHLLSTECLLSLLPGVLEPPGVLLRFHTLCTSTGCPLKDDTANTQGFNVLVLIFFHLMCHTTCSPCDQSTDSYRSLYRGQRETLQPSASHPYPHVSWGEPACFWWLCRSLAWSSHLSVGEVPEMQRLWIAQYFCHPKTWCTYSHSCLQLWGHWNQSEQNTEMSLGPQTLSALHIKA